MTRLLCVLVILLYFFSRFFNLMQLPLFNDEAFFIHAAKQIIADPKANLFFNFSDGKEPFFFWLYSIPVAIFPDALIAIRVFTGLLGFLGLWYFYKIAKKILSPAGQFFACVLYIFSPFLLFYQRIGMQETLLTFLLIGAVYYLLEKKKVLTGIFIGLALLTKTTSMAFLVFLLPYLIYKRNFKTILVAALIYLPVFFGLQNVVGHNSSYAGVIPVSLMVTNFKQATRWLVEYQGLAGVLGLIGPVMLESAVAKIFFPRYFLFVVPFSLLAAVFIFEKLKSKLLKGLIFLVIFIPNVFLTWQIIFDIKQAPLPYIERWQYLESWPSGFGIKETADFLRSQGAATIVTEDIMITRYGLPYFFPQGKYQIGGTGQYFVFARQQEVSDPTLIMRYEYKKPTGRERITVYQKI